MHIHILQISPCRDAETEVLYPGEKNERGLKMNFAAYHSEAGNFPQENGMESTLALDVLEWGKQLVGERDEWSRMQLAETCLAAVPHTESTSCRVHKP